MSRGQQSQVIDTAKANSGTDQTNATDALTAEKGDIGNYQAQLSKYAASNPFTEGGEFDTATDQKLSAVADAGSGAIQNQEQTIAKRTGENAGSGEAIASEAARENQRQLSADEAGATQTRIGAKAGYDKSVVDASLAPAQLEEGIYGTSLSGGNSALGIENDAAKTPGFWDTLGDSFANGLGSTVGKGVGGGFKG
jgi:hypothetical protein